MSRQIKIKIIKDETQFDSSAINVFATPFHADIQAISRKCFNNQEQRNKNIPRNVVEKVKNCIEDTLKDTDCQLSHHRDATKHVNNFIRLAIAEYFEKK